MGSTKLIIVILCDSTQTVAVIEVSTLWYCIENFFLSDLRTVVVPRSDISSLLAMNYADMEIRTVEPTPTDHGTPPSDRKFTRGHLKLYIILPIYYWTVYSHFERMNIREQLNALTWKMSPRLLNYSTAAMMLMSWLLSVAVSFDCSRGHGDFLSQCDIWASHFSVFELHPRVTEVLW